MKRDPDRLRVIGTADVSLPAPPRSPQRDRVASPVPPAIDTSLLPLPSSSPRVASPTPTVADASLLPLLHGPTLHDREPCPVPLDDAEAWFAAVAERDDKAAWAEQILIEAHLDRILAEPW